LKEIKVGIVIVNYNGKADTLACLHSLQKLEIRNLKFEIIIVDNASIDDSVVAIKKQFPWVKVIENQENLGFVGGNNVGIKRVLQNGADYVLVLNNDTLVSKNLLQELLRISGRDPKIGIIVPKIYFASGYEFHKERYSSKDLGRIIWYAGGKIDWRNMFGVHLGVDEVDRGQFEEEKEITFATGCCLLIKREVLTKIALFDEKFFLYGEDVDFSIRVVRAGFKIFYAPKAHLWHKNAGSSSAGSSLHDYYITRNRLLLGWRYAPWRVKLALLKQSGQRLIQGRDWEKKGIIDFYLGKFRKGSYEN